MRETNEKPVPYDECPNLAESGRLGLEEPNRPPADCTVNGLKRRAPAATHRRCNCTKD